MKNFATRADWIAIIGSFVVLAATGAATGFVAVGNALPTEVLWVLLVAAVAVALPQLIVRRVADRKSLAGRSARFS